ncbi:hypothetical protein K3172_13720 [Qipengyuania sp. 6B39]|uniref:hypothetical protein n=1 Tax=Qipengyuania proteolytica TaxID=2867239 RepID=UPI001C89D915|nr:hypothetical protein [Qipengyuania proteolytica]MBX7496916.1 hypothetical protein [Qipengyuania proteolytica]
MESPATLLFGAYRGTADDLELVATGQRLTLARRDGDFLHCTYSDGELDLASRARETLRNPDPGRVSAELTVGFGPENAGAVLQEYGLWRRLSWFLLEALLVRLAIEHEGRHFSQLEVRLDGGWLSTGWSDRVRLQIHAFNLHESSRLVGPQPSGLLTPRDRPVPSARLLRGTSPTAEVTREMAVSAGADGIAGLLEHVPRYELSDGTVLFFSQVNPHSGPEYAPSLTVGMFTDGALLCAAYVHGTYSGVPVALAGDPAALVRTAEGRSYGPEGGMIPTRVPLASLIEQQFYARLAAAEVTRPADYRARPQMTHPEFPDQTIAFGIGQATCGCLPYAIGLGNGPRGFVLNENVQDNPDTVGNRARPVPDRLLDLDELLGKHGIELGTSPPRKSPRPGLLDRLAPYSALIFFSLLLFFIFDDALDSTPLALLFTALAAPLLYAKLKIDEAVVRRIARR